jgi:hypothetical protein
MPRRYVAAGSSACIHAFLPLGLPALDKVRAIIHEEQNRPVRPPDCRQKSLPDLGRFWGATTGPVFWSGQGG